MLTLKLFKCLKEIKLPFSGHAFNSDLPSNIPFYLSICCINHRKINSYISFDGLDYIRYCMSK